MIELHKANNVPHFKSAKTLGAFTTGAASLLLVASIAVAEPQSNTQDVEMANATISTEQRSEFIAPSGTTDGDGGAEYWEDPCGGPLPDHVVSMS